MNIQSFGCIYSSGKKGVLLPIVLFLMISFAAVLPLIMHMAQLTQNRAGYGEEWLRIQWALQGIAQRTVKSADWLIDQNVAGNVSTVAAFSYSDGFKVYAKLAGSRTLFSKNVSLNASARATRLSGDAEVDAGYNLEFVKFLTLALPGISAGSEFSFAWKADGSLWSWGSNSNGQLGTSTISLSTKPVLVSSGMSPNSEEYFSQGWLVDGGGAHALAVDFAGNVYSWGKNANMQLGRTTSPTYEPGNVTLYRCVDLAGGRDFSIGLADGKIYGWGYNDRGQLGKGDTTTANSPALVSYLEGLKTIGIAVGNRHSMAMIATSTLDGSILAGDIYAWGDNTYGQLGPMGYYGRTGFLWPERRSLTPVLANNMDATWVALVEPGASLNTGPNSTTFNIAVPYNIASFSALVNAKPNSWLSGFYMYRHAIFLYLNNTNPQTTTSPNQILLVAPDQPASNTWIFDGTSDLRQLSPGSYTVKIGQARSFLWGAGAWSFHSFLNDIWYKRVDASSPDNNKGIYGFFGAPVERPSGYVGIAAGGDFSMALNASGSQTILYSWGRNHKGQLGTGDTLDRNRMKSINFPTTNVKIVSIAAGEEHALALTDSGIVYTWGSNEYKQLGRTPTTSNPANVPRMIAFPGDAEKIVRIAAGDYHCLAMDKDGKVYSWGRNNSGQLGLGNKTDKESPTVISDF